jgi:hypothetical protein
MANTSLGPFNSQQSPARFFVMDPIKSIEDYERLRDGAFGILAGKMTEKGQIPQAYDVRPISPLDDLMSISTGSSFAADWSIASSALSNVTASLSSAGNTIVSGTMPQDRFMVIYGTEIETPGTAPEVYWKWSAGANTKSIWFLQDLFGFEYPRAVTRQVPTWGPSEPVTAICYVVAQQPVVDAHLTLWSEPNGTTITASTLRA